MSEEPVVSKIKKLLALALNNPNEAEATAAMQKAHALMEQHAVDEARVRGADVAPGIAIYEFRNNRKFQGWMNLVFAGVAALYDARCFIAAGKERDTAVFVTAEHDAALLRETTEFVIATILREAAISCRGLAAANSFRSGAAEAFNEAATYIQKQTKEAELKAKGAGKETAAIVRLKRDTIAEEAKKMFPNSRPFSIQISQADAAAYFEGRALGATLGKAQNKLEE